MHAGLVGQFYLIRHVCLFSRGKDNCTKGLVESEYLDKGNGQGLKYSPEFAAQTFSFQRKLSGGNF